MYKEIPNSVGHGGKNKRDPGAVGILREHDEALLIAAQVTEKVEAAGGKAPLFVDTTSTSASGVVNNLVAMHKQQEKALGVNNVLNIQWHLNSSGGTHTRPIGVEVLHFGPSTKWLAEELSALIANILGLPNRGAKQRKDLGFLRLTKGASLLVETCFVNSHADAKALHENRDKMTTAVAEWQLKKMGIDKKVDTPEEPKPQSPAINKEEEEQLKLNGTTRKDIMFLNNYAVKRGIFSHRIATRKELEDAKKKSGWEKHYNKTPLEDMTNEELTNKLFSYMARKEYMQ